ncbi:MAG: glucose-6-phosphate dehydrogenase [Candidatus Kerfeldbacteria bacterium CG15_BIG_FIL_POST_REV_8_21_14_020_45_12]|uniref:Glucose-6-phosphate 1-dehydrogenase n=1 Tax=Candidatus Kerfeldbacteria bacterium CG15_BIG_FIL_POST_REV_8_21_14_020_45_12 TaxID=2014247 RepID=A0A2M7H3W5_9BACT|nr:MAG: glucose-6-phosphate dehydrogenase [Candidatus Kerfeldbacteria bacterium CG15_BIG_FIL_POST_REV_8_21_14_020_45_12]PJA94028.1 MAG: glucose-6-phosphate dehydrogenase [Candidatus Kerfeldbacteria bacterium CG_4_9_14_3_um_filter_45_8]
MVSKRAHTNYLPTVFTIFGITGDLAKRKLIPAIYHLYCHGLLPEEIHFVGVGRRDLSLGDYGEMIKQSVTYAEGKVDADKLASFAALFSYVEGDIKSPKAYADIGQEIAKRDKDCGHGHQTVFYLAVAPQMFIRIIEHLKEASLTGPCYELGIKGKIVIEKPFGHSVESARQLSEAVMTYADEEQIYRMDHYLGKETVQNILLFRFTNPVINDSWNPEAIDHIQITASEDIGVEDRAGYYDSSGALRDMIQSHCLALATLVMMDEPMSLNSADIHRRKVEMLQTFSLDSNPAESAVRAQYDGYRAIETVAEHSVTETFAAMQLKSSHPRWKDVPIFIRTGKRMAQKETNIAIHFAPCKSDICKAVGIRTEPNVLNIRVQPMEGIGLLLYAKKPGFSIETEQVYMNFTYQTEFTDEQPSPYERLIHDVIIGDQSLFPTTEEVMEQWRIVQPVLDAWSDQALPMHSYAPGEDGPQAAHDLIGQWHDSTWTAGVGKQMNSDAQ